MKIIKRGTMPGDRIWTATCRQCKTEVEEQQRRLDIKHGRYEHEAPWAETPCPVCGYRLLWAATERFESGGGAP